MKHPGNIPLISTIQERCRVCYTCVRECPAKAIRIAVGQAEVIPERCIACGNCVRVCSQHAKRVLESGDYTRRLLAYGVKTAAIIAPSFPAEFHRLEERQLVGMLRGLGFPLVCEVAFGADLVARRYRQLLEASDGRRYIATTCPAIVAYIERYYPQLVEHLAPVVSPMVATARALRRLHGPDLNVVFVGPCIAKKGEAAGSDVAGEIQAALTFVELRQMFAESQLCPENTAPSDFDPPHARLGVLFPISRGLFQVAGIHEDLLDGQVVSADGRSNFVEAIKEFEAGDLDARLLEVLACTGCIMGPGMDDEAPLFVRRHRVSRHARLRQARFDLAAWEASMAKLADLDLSRQFRPYDQRMAVPFPDEINLIMAKMGKLQPEDELNCGACGYDTCREHAVAIFKGLAESEMCLPHTIEQLRRTIGELAASNQQLASTQEQLMQSEKLASMGQLAAGIAHEVNNPLGVVLMYAHLLLEEYGGNPALKEDLAMIAEQADRCKKIVAGLLNFARQNKALLEMTDLRALAERTLKTVPAPENVRVAVRCNLEDPSAEVDRDQIAQVLTNLVTNAFAAMPSDGQLLVTINGDDGRVSLAVADTGIGIPPENMGKIFEPFFTTKQIGLGTGLGLAVTYGIVKMHRGDIKVSSNADPAKGLTGSTFTVTLPRRARQD